MISKDIIKIGPLTFDVRIAGDNPNELVILLHGFPETSHMWIKLMGKLAASGFYCVAPNMRGYSEGAQPRGIRKYELDYLSEDVVAIADHLGKDQFHLIGHDWGSAVGWSWPRKR